MSATSSQARRLFANLALIAGVTLSLSACDYISSFSKPKQTPEEAKAEGIALGAGCRQAGQTLEDCYQRNPDALKAGIFTGWKDMHEYMAAKGIQTVTPPTPPAADAAKDDGKGKDSKDAKDAKDSASDRSSRSRDRDTNRDSSRSRDRESSSSSKDSGSSSDRRASRDEKQPPKY
ncbi:MAG: hypothetical protein GAK35_00973 [Herbaspirillum frisingense]|uniref:Lipoprotein n=1 Tax=Herbaspirillum frisingense TaxID=92645 RepID=A0A7V8JV86_9BURK|nr:MAG: hypothetical protein GAK35_00973 [Herbaspirillum frisingense]